MDNALISLKHEQQQEAVEEIQKLAKQGISMGQAIQIIANQLREKISTKSIRSNGGNQMKKMMIATLALISASVMAAPKTETTSTAKDPINGQPAVVLNVYDVSSKSPSLVKGTQISRSQNQQLCWSSLNVPLTGRVRIAEAFYAPAPTNFASEGMSVTASEDKKEFLIVGDVIAKDKENITRCWKFGKSDPIGKYGMEVQIGNYVFRNLAFEVVK